MDVITIVMAMGTVNYMLTAGGVAAEMAGKEKIAALPWRYNVVTSLITMTAS